MHSVLVRVQIVAQPHSGCNTIDFVVEREEGLPLHVAVHGSVMPALLPLSLAHEHPHTSANSGKTCT